MNLFLKWIGMFFLVTGLAFSQTKQEQRLAKLLKKFPQADTNKDGTLTAEEEKAFRKIKQRRSEGSRAGTPKPTHANVKYGPHERNVIDIWLPENREKPAPILIYFHGGGFVAGDKSRFNPQPYLKAGMAVASGNYRFVDGRETLIMDSLSDAARAVQFVKSKAQEWKLDKEKFALSGGSAGAVITLWIGYHDDLAKKSGDPIEQESTRVAALLPINGPVNLDPVWIRKNMGGPHNIHGSMPKMYGSNWDTEAGRSAILAASPWELVTKDDPPTFLIYSTKLTPVPLPQSASSGELVHHPHFGVALKAKLDNIGVPTKLVHGSDPRGNSSMVDYLKAQFGTPAP